MAAYHDYRFTFPADSDPDIPNVPLEYQLIETNGGIPPDPLPRLLYEYYLAQLTGDVLADPLPRHSLTYYYAKLAGVTEAEAEGKPLEYLMILAAGGVPTYPLPNRPLKYYLSEYNLEGFEFKLSEIPGTAGYGQLYLVGEAPLPKFSVNANGNLVYDDTTLPAGYSNVKLDKNTGHVTAEKA
jgi:hypothetical protein